MVNIYIYDHVCDFLDLEYYYKILKTNLLFGYMC